MYRMFNLYILVQITFQKEFNIAMKSYKRMGMNWITGTYQTF